MPPKNLYKAVSTHRLNSKGTLLDSDCHVIKKFGLFQVRKCGNRPSSGTAVIYGRGPLHSLVSITHVHRYLDFNCCRQWPSFKGSPVQLVIHDTIIPQFPWNLHTAYFDSNDVQVDNLLFLHQHNETIIKPSSKLNHSVSWKHKVWTFFFQVSDWYPVQHSWKQYHITGKWLLSFDPVPSTMTRHNQDLPSIVDRGKQKELWNGRRKFLQTSAMLNPFPPYASVEVIPTNLDNLLRWALSSPPWSWLRHRVSTSRVVMPLGPKYSLLRNHVWPLRATEAALILEQTTNAKA